MDIEKLYDSIAALTVMHDEMKRELVRLEDSLNDYELRLFSVSLDEALAEQEEDDRDLADIVNEIITSDTVDDWDSMDDDKFYQAYRAEWVGRNPRGVEECECSDCKRYWSIHYRNSAASDYRMD